MLNNNKDEFASLEMLSLLSYAITGGLEAVKEQLSQLQQAEKNPRFLDGETFDQIIYSCKEQTEAIADEKELCAHWCKQNLTADQIKLIEEITVNLIEMEKINQRILFLATHYKERRHDKIFNLQDSELMSSSLTEKLCPPVNSSNIANHEHKSFSLPPEVTYQYEKIGNKEEFYIFHHSEWGEIGRIHIILNGSQPQVTIDEVGGDPKDPLTGLRHALFRIVVLEFSGELEKKYRPDISVILDYFDPKLKKNG